MRHQAGDVAGSIPDAGNRAHRPIGVGGIVRFAGDRAIRADVSEQDLVVGFELVQHGRLGEVAALAMGDRHPERSARPSEARERRVRLFHGDVNVASRESHAPVAEQCAGHEPGLSKDLEPVADAEDHAAVRGKGRDRSHDGAEPGDHSGPKVVAVGESTGQDDPGDTLQVGLFVP